jgi:hypothetical protein
METKLIIGALAVVFLGAATARILRDHGKIGPAARTWLLVAAIFGAVAAYLGFGGV